MRRITCRYTLLPATFSFGRPAYRVHDRLVHHVPQRMKIVRLWATAFSLSSVPMMLQAEGGTTCESSFRQDSNAPVGRMMTGGYLDTSS
jgi:hypothetical protein